MKARNGSIFRCLLGLIITVSVILPLIIQPHAENASSDSSLSASQPESVSTAPSAASAASMESSVPVSQNVTAPAKLSKPAVSASQIAAGLGIASNFAVFARSFTLAGDMEGNVAVDSFQEEGLGIGNTADVYANAGSFNLDISIQAGAANAGRNLEVGIYTNAAGTALYKKVSVTTGGSGSGSASVSGLNGSTVYYAYLLDGSDNPVISGDSQGITGGGGVASTGNDSYIQTVKSVKQQGELFKSAASGGSDFPQSTTFGKGYTLTSENNSLTGQTAGDGTYSLVDSGGIKIISPKIGGGKTNKVTIATGTFPIDFNSAFPGLSHLSSTLASSGDSSSVKVIDVSLEAGETLQYALADALGEDRNNGLTGSGIPLNPGQYLVVNVDCKSNSSVTIPACKIGGTDYGARYAEVAGRVIWNFFSGGNAFSGAVNTATGMLGTILAPSASVSIGSTMCGAVYADSVTNPGGEIHKLPFRIPPVTRCVGFTVPYSVAVHKIWADDDNSAKARPAEITVNLLKNGAPYLSEVLNDGNHWSCTFSNLPNNDQYTVREAEVSGYDVSYDNSASGIVTIKNTYSQKFVLPAAGGMGTGVFDGIGSGIILLAAILIYVAKRRVGNKSG